MATINHSKPLRPRARILRTLGEELISSETVAIIELVKNSYDADARVVLVQFIESLQKGFGRIDLVDDGHGMTLSTVRSAWMEPATNVKKKARHSTYLKRRLLGEKGVGRFASARLAQELELATRTPGAADEVYAVFDWTQFDDEDLYLDEVLILTEERSPKEIVKGRPLPVDTAQSKHKDLPRDGSHGTILRMNRLKRTWGDHEIDDLKRGLSRLVSPFDADQDFRIFLQLPTDHAENAQELEPPQIIKYPHYTVDGNIESNGQYALKIQVHAEADAVNQSGWLRRKIQGRASEVISLANDQLPENSRPLTCGPLSFRVLVWDRDQLDSVDQKLGIGLSSIRKDLNAVAGISIYRDGFRVLPYGEPDNDWLRLDIRRVQNPTLRLSNNQLTGYIKIGADTNPLLRDQSNREGLDNNDAYSDLHGVMMLCIAQLEEVRFKAKNSQPTAERTHDGGLLVSPNVSALRVKLVALKPDKATLELFDEKTKEWENQVTRVREALSRYHSLATIGQLIDKTVHDSRQPLSTIQGQTGLAKEAIADWLDLKDLDPDCREHLTEIDSRLTKIKEAAGVIDTVVRRIEPLGGRKRGRPKKLYLEEIIRSAFSFYENEIRELGVIVTLPNDLNLVSVDSAELQEVLMNLLSNSLHWLSHVPKNKRAVLVKVSRPKPGQIEIIFADSGPGVPAQNRNAIFEPYFSTRPEGVGLGLVMAGEIVREYYDGSLELLKSGPLGGAVFRVVLNKRV
jgi:signal transduction histidine kinase